MNKRVAIVGFAPSWVDTPWGDASFDVWTMNYHHEAVPRTDRIFEMHPWAVVQIEDGGSHVPTLAKAACPVYMLDVHPEIPTSERYPIEAMSVKYTLPHADLAYFTNTASYMVASAIEAGYEEIQTFGIDMAHDTEYGTYRPSCEFFLGVAFGKGIKVIPHRTSDLLKTAYLYGYEDAKRDWFREKLLARRADLELKRNHYLGEMEKARAAASEFNGALQNNDHILKVWAQ